MNYREIYTDIFKTVGRFYSGQSYQHDYFCKAIVTIEPRKTLIDLGSGHGWVSDLCQAKELDTVVTEVDLGHFSDHEDEFINADLTEAKDLKKLRKRHWDVATCLDVIEHLPRDKQRDVFSTISQISDHSILSIAATDDRVNGHSLHLTIEDADYYRPLLEEFFIILDEWEHPDVYHVILRSRNAHQ